jgi:hypothetical protein
MTIHVGGYFNIDGINAQVQEIGKNGSEIATISGIITENTHFIFRSRSTRINGWQCITIDGFKVLYTNWPVHSTTLW